MRKKLSSTPAYTKRGRFAIVAAKYNRRHVNAILKSARLTLKDGGADSIQVWRVPGSFEIPVVASHLASDPQKRYVAVVCLGVIFEGDTRHADQIASAVSDTLAHLQVTSGTPVIHGVGLFDSVDQANARCLDPDHNRGREAALTALEMADVMRKLKGQ